MNKELKREKTSVGLYKRGNRTIQNRRWLSKNKDKKAAHNSVYWAIKTGKLNKSNICDVCKEEYPLHMIYAHHEDYSKKLEVLWLCFWCHYKIHKEKEVANNELCTITN